MRKRVFEDVISSIKELTNPPSSDSNTRQLIARYPEAIADPKNICPKSLDEAVTLFDRTTEAFNVVDGYAKK